VVAFEIGGLPDIVEHGQTGWLAPAFDIELMAEGIRWVMSQRETGRLAEQDRERAVARFAYSVVAAGYRQVYAACGSCL
jgi:glycosyltransferase involved in cell wall biosynthesis